MPVLEEGLTAPGFCPLPSWTREPQKPVCLQSLFPNADPVCPTPPERGCLSSPGPLWVLNGV